MNVVEETEIGLKKIFGTFSKQCLMGKEKGNFDLPVNSMSWSTVEDTSREFIHHGL